MTDPSILIEPFDQSDTIQIVLWYIATAIGGQVVSKIHKLAGVNIASEMREQMLGFIDDTSVAIVFIAVTVIAPAIEELLFRIGPAMIGVETVGIIIFSIIWALLHAKRALVILVAVPLFVKMTLAGMYAEMIIVHMVHNTISMCLFFYREGKRNTEVV